MPPSWSTPMTAGKSRPLSVTARETAAQNAARESAATYLEGVARHIREAAAAVTPLRHAVEGFDALGAQVSAARATALLARAHLVHQPLPPEVAAWGSLAEFALSIRAAAEGTRAAIGIRRSLLPEERKIP